MDSEKIGQFICSQRKEHGMTQKQLAEHLGITDKAVSKWERGLSSPDVGLLIPLSNLFGISVTELLNGELTPSDPPELVETVIECAQQSVDERMNRVSRTAAVLITAILFAAAVTCTVVNLASGGKPWAWIPVLSCAFLWAAAVPAVLRRRITAAVPALSAAILPYLVLLDFSIRALSRTAPSILPIGIPAAVIGLLWLWSAYALLHRMKRKKRAAALICFSVLPVILLINATVTAVVGTPFLNLWDWLAMTVFTAAGAVLWKIG